MAASDVSVASSGNDNTDALLVGSKWNTGNLTFSFPSSASFYSYSGEPQQSFEAAPADVRDEVRRAFAIVSIYANVTFTEVNETSSQHADIRVAFADLTDALGRGYFPGDAPAQSGDVWFATRYANVMNIQDILHEIGHSLGLSHPGSSMDPSHVGWDYTVMSYEQYPNAEFIGEGEISQTPMLDDVAALQYMYGANFTANSGNTTYSWNSSGEMFVNGIGQGDPQSFQDNIYMTLWDGGGIDTYDFSNYTTDAIIDLRPGEWSSPSPSQIAVLNSHRKTGDPVILARGSIANAYLYNGDTRSLIENANGGSGNDALTGNQADNVLSGNGGDDRFFYTSGFDKFFGGGKGVSGDTADFSLSEVGVVINPVATTTTIRLPNGQIVTTPILDTSPLADSAGNAYDASYVSDLGGVFRLVEMHGIENINGSSFADTITGNLGDNVIKAGGGNDRVYYTGGIDNLAGEGGTDTVDFSRFGFAVSVTLSTFIGQAEAYSTDTSSILTAVSLRPIAELSGFERVVGTAFADSLAGNASDNVLDGGAGDDFLFCDAAGLDTLNGNTGIDTAEFSRMASAVFVDLAGGGFEAKSNGTQNANSGGLFSIADLQSIENLTGTSYDDVLRGDGNANLIDGRSGDDLLVGRGGNDVARGGAGNDTYDFRGAALGSDVFSDESGNDRILIDSLSDVLDAARVRNDLVLTLKTGTIKIVDHFNGHAIETLQDRSSSVVLATGLIGAGLPGIIAGSDAGETLDGQGGGDLLFGGKGNDRLLGGEGNDLLAGGRGNDILTGGVGADTFVFAEHNGHDRITDFEFGVDHLKLADGMRIREIEVERCDRNGSVDVTLEFGDGSVTLENVAPAQLWQLWHLV